MASCRACGVRRGLRRICDDNGIVLVADEVQTGFGRTGRMFAMEHFGVEPDLMIVAKSIAGGLPLSGVVGRAAIMDDLPLGRDRRRRSSAAPVALAAALAVLDVFEEQLVDRAQLLGAALRARMLDWQVHGRGSATCAGWAPCSRSSSCGIRSRRSRLGTRRSRHRRRVAARALLLKAGVDKELHPRALSADDVGHELDDGLRAWEEALAAVLLRSARAHG